MVRPPMTLVRRGARPDEIPADGFETPELHHWNPRRRSAADSRSQIDPGLSPVQRANIATRERLEGMNRDAAERRRNGFWGRAGK